MISEQITQGVERAPQRSLLYAAGFTEDEIKKPLIGVVSAQSEIIPGHMHLSKIAEAVKAGIYAAGGTPVVVPAIGVCDGIVMGHRGYAILVCEEFSCLEFHMNRDTISWILKKNTGGRYGEIGKTDS